MDDERRADIVGVFDSALAHSSAVIDELDLDTEGYVPWWGAAGNPVTLARIIVHVTTEIYRHLGQIDILRESIDSSVGMRPGAENMPLNEDADWSAYCAKLERIARDS